MKKINFLLVACCCLSVSFTQAQLNWKLAGNAGTVPGTDFIGTTDAKDLVLKTNNAERLRLKANTGSLRVSNTGNDYILYGTKSGTGYGIYISNNSAANISAAIYGRNSGTGNGLYGYSAGGVGIYGTTNGVNTYGVHGNSSHAGVYGTGTSYGVSGYGSGTYGIGVWGNGVDYGVYGYSYEGTGVNALNYADNNYALYVSANNYRGMYCEGGSGWYTAYFNGDVYATGVFQSSDARLKKNVKPVDNALDIINKLQPKNYEFRNDGNYSLMHLPKGSHYGLLAQEVEQILPGLVKEEQFNTADAMQRVALKADSSGMVPQLLAENISASKETIPVKAVNYTELIPILIKAMQELSQQVNAKDERINALQQQLNELKNGAAVQSGNSKIIMLSGASLSQNAPNPFVKGTTINYTLPQSFGTAKIVITDNYGKVIKDMKVTGSGKGSLYTDASSLAAGTYQYSLYVDGKLVETKQMVLQK